MTARTILDRNFDLAAEPIATSALLQPVDRNLARAVNRSFDGMLQVMQWETSLGQSRSD
jgi:hypothetical protein